MRHHLCPLIFGWLHFEIEYSVTGCNINIITIRTDIIIFFISLKLKVKWHDILLLHS